MDEPIEKGQFYPLTRMLCFSNINIMTKKLFLVYKLVAVTVVAIVVSVSVNYGNWYLPVIFLITAWISLYALRNRVKEVITDERDYKIAGKASMWAMTIYVSFSVIAGLILYIAEKENEVLFAIGSTLLYSVCFLMLLYSVLFKIYERRNERD